MYTRMSSRFLGVCVTDSMQNQFSEVYCSFFFPFSNCVCLLHVCGHEYVSTHSCVHVHECGYPKVDFGIVFHYFSLSTEVNYVYENQSLQTWVICSACSADLPSLLCKPRFCHVHSQRRLGTGLKRAFCT